MEIEPNPNQEQKFPFAFFWLIVGLIPIPVLLALGSPNGAHSSWAGATVLVCALCSLCGGMGCAGGIKNAGGRLIVGFLLASFFLFLSWVIAGFQAVSHSHLM
ncbi:MAG TPA: hypothetical protein VNN22_08730 [Verrucomicrobiae bacterium]|nr:hypothetical protein [Verrucomicrobiae bacterium]